MPEKNKKNNTEDKTNKINFLQKIKYMYILYTVIQFESATKKR